MKTEAGTKTGEEQATSKGFNKSRLPVPHGNIQKAAVKYSGRLVYADYTYVAAARDVLQLGAFELIGSVERDLLDPPVNILGECLVSPVYGWVEEVELPVGTLVECLVCLLLCLPAAYCVRRFNLHPRQIYIHRHSSPRLLRRAGRSPRVIKASIRIVKKITAVILFYFAGREPFEQDFSGWLLQEEEFGGLGGPEERVADRTVLRKLREAKKAQLAE